MRKYLKLFIYILLILYIKINSEITIIGNSGLIKEVKHLEPSGIISKIGNFGQVPYGKTIIGEVYYSPNTDRTNNWCNSSKTLTPQNLDPNSGGSEFTPIFLVDHSTECHYTQKALNVRDKGGRVMILISDSDDMHDECNYDDNFGNRLDIPSIIITNKIGELFKHFLEDKPEEKLMLNIKFSETSKDGMVNMELFFKGDDIKALSFFREFKQYYIKMGKRFNLTPYYKYINDANGEIENDIYAISKAPCIKDGYCIGSSGTLNIENPRLILLENLRQSCIYTIYGLDIYWDYMEVFTELCANTIRPDYNENCAKNVLKLLEINGKDKTFSDIYTCMETLVNKHSKVNEDYLYFQSKNIYSVPELFINGVKYKGGWYSKYIFDFICNGFIEDDDNICSVTPKIQIFKSINLVAIITVTIIIITIFSLYCYRRMVNKSLEASISEKIQQQTILSLGQYTEFKDSKKETNQFDNPFGLMPSNYKGIEIQMNDKEDSSIP